MIGLDHHYPGSKDSPVVVILYAEIGTGAFSQWHTVLQEKAKHGDIDYILRHYVHVCLPQFKTFVGKVFILNILAMHFST